jgi:hypothetical protein
MHLPKKDKLKQRKIENWIEASIIVIGYVSPTKNLQELSWYPKYGRIFLYIGFNICKELKEFGNNMD